VIVDGLSAAYAAAATWRRRWYAVPGRARRLSRPVVSIGNLRVGGTGKTPTVADVARLLRDRGERPVILSRGYGRERSTDDVTVVSDREAIRADVAHSGDEPMLLARALPGVPVLVCADRYRAGRHAESVFDPTVHLLDDGFQHVMLARDVDLLLVDEHDLDDRVLPAGRLREPLENASIADAVIVPDAGPDRARKVAERLGIATAFGLRRTLGTPGRLNGEPAHLAADAPVFAVAGIARPERFFDDIRRAGLRVAGTWSFGDHHRFQQRDVSAIAARARSAHASVVVTTEKDGVRLERLDLSAMPFLTVPLHATVGPRGPFGDWLARQLMDARSPAAAGPTR
jgi:tetraacyldisaccharide 4'-kinase